MKKKVAIIGAGISGLTCAYYLNKINDIEIDIYEADKSAGGLASYFNYENGIIENYYHYYLPYDKTLIELCKELKIDLNFKPVKIGYYHNSNLYNYSHLTDYLTFNCIILIERFRNLIGTGLLLIFIKLGLFKLSTAEKIFNIFIGKQNYNFFWKNLIDKKFHSLSSDLTLNWLIYRIIRISKNQKLFSNPLYAYFNNQTKDLLDALIKKLEFRANIFLNTPVNSIRQADDKFIINNKNYDFLISTIALNRFKELIKNLDAEFYEKLSQIIYLDLIAPVFIVNKKITDYFWINISDQNCLFPGIIEFTNLNSNIWSNKEYSLVYFPYYYLKNMEIKNDDFYFDEAFKTLKMISPSINQSDIIKKFIFKNQNAQPFSNSEFYKLKLKVTTPIKNLYISDSSIFQPEDRSLSECIKLSQKIIFEISRSL